MLLKNAPSIFQRNIQRIFKDLPAVRCFIDDGIIGGRSVEELYMNLRKVLEVLRDNKMLRASNVLHEGLERQKNRNSLFSANDDNYFEDYDGDRPSRKLFKSFKQIVCTSSFIRVGRIVVDGLGSKQY